MLDSYIKLWELIDKQEELDKKKDELQDVIKKTKSVKDKRISAQEKLLTLK